MAHEAIDISTKLLLALIAINLGNAIIVLVLFMINEYFSGDWIGYLAILIGSCLVGSGILYLGYIYNIEILVVFSFPVGLLGGVASVYLVSQILDLC